MARKEKDFACGLIRSKEKKSLSFSLLRGKKIKVRAYAAVKSLVVRELSNRAARLCFIKLGRDHRVDIESGNERNEPDGRNL